MLYEMRADAKELLKVVSKQVDSKTLSSSNAVTALGVML